MKSTTTDIDAMHNLLVSGLTRAWEAGNPVAGSTDGARQRIASVIQRRWQALSGREILREDRAAVTRDLAQTLIAAFEADPRLVGPLTLDYEHLASQVLAVLQSHTDGHSSNHPGT